MTLEHKAQMEQMQRQILDAVDICAPEKEITFKAMFGGMTGYCDGRNFASLSNVGLALKLSPATQAQLLEVKGAKRLQYEPDSPLSKSSIVVPPALCANAEAFSFWVGESLDYVATLPPPKSRPKKTP